MGWRWSPVAVARTIACCLSAASAGAAQLATPVDLTLTVERPGLLPPADVDGDGDLDLLVTASGGRTLYWVEQGLPQGGRLTELLRAPTGEAIWRMADLDGDGDLDALALRRAPAQLHVFERGPSGFLPARREAAFPCEALDLEVGDLTRDGLPDVLIALDGGPPAHRGHFVLPGIGGGRLGWAARFTPGSQVSAAIVTGPFQLVDLDRDGDLDVLVHDLEGHRVVWFRYQGGPFAQGPIVVDDRLRELASVEARDLDGDGRPDLIAGGTSSDLDHAREVFVHRGANNGAFLPRVTVHSDPTRTPAPLRTGDVDGDGDLDLLLADGEGQHVWFDNQGSAVAGGPRPLPGRSGWLVAGSEVADVDGDGLPDVVVTGAEARVGWCRGRPGGDHLPPEGLTEPVEGARAIAATDVDADGDLDLLVADAGLHGLVRFENLGAGDFSAPAPAAGADLLGGTVERLLSADLDGDGDLDVVAASFTEGWLQLLAAGPGGLAPPVRLHDFAPAPGGTLRAADVDGDGVLDLVLTVLGDGDLRWFRGGVGGPETVPRVLVSGQPQVTDLEVRDIDADGAVDLVLTGPGFGGTVGWFPGQGNGVFGARVAVPTINFQPRNVVSLDADGDGDLDLAVGGAGFVFPLLEWIPQVAPGQFGGPDYVGSAVQGWEDVLTADVDLDGDLDLVTTPRDASVEPLAVTVYTAPFGGPPQVLARPQGVSSLDVLDVDADGDADVLFTSERGGSVTLARGVARGFLGEEECPGPPSLGVTLEAVGSGVRADNAFRLRARGLLPGSTALFLASTVPAQVPGAGGSLGSLCLGGAIGRFDAPGQVTAADGAGTAALDVDLSAVPQPAGPRGVLVGETWRFQAWFRGAEAGLATSNFSGSLAVRFR